MNKSIVITKIKTLDKRFKLKGNAGSDAVHKKPTYAYATTVLHTDSNLEGIGLTFTLGKGNNLVCQAIKHLKKHIINKEINELMHDFGKTVCEMANDPALRWIGPHKGVVHLALASITNACYDLWAKSRGLPLWKLLIELPPEAIINTLDFSYYEDILASQEALDILTKGHLTKSERLPILERGYKGYDTSIGWFSYTENQIVENIKKSIDQGFTTMKLKVGSKDPLRDIKRAELVRKTAGNQVTIMFDANQQWTLPQAINICGELKNLDPYWIEEPTHPDDIQAHVTLAKEIPIKIALGEHVPNKIVFKNFIQSGCMSFNQVDALRVGGISEFLLISLLSKKYEIPVIPHVGDMGQVHQHLVLFNHIVMEHPALFLEHIPHLQPYFKYPVIIEQGHYKTPQEPGASADFIV